MKGRLVLVLSHVLFCSLLFTGSRAAAQSKPASPSPTAAPRVVLTLQSERVLTPYFAVPQTVDVESGQQDRAYEAGLRQRLKTVAAPVPQKTPVPVKSRTRSSNSSSPGANSNVETGGPSTTMTLTVLANEITYGANGPHVPTFLDFQIGTNPRQQAFSGGQVSVGAQQVLDLGSESNSVVLFGHTPHHEVSNEDLVNAITFIDGMDFQATLLSKNVQEGYPSQQHLVNIMAPYIDGSGFVTLPANVIIFVFELGGAFGPWSDYDDLVLYAELSGGVGTGITLRESIGSSAEQEGHVGFSNFEEIIGGAIKETLAQFEVPVDSQLSELSMLIYHLGAGSLTGPCQDYHLRVWHSFEEASISPTTGTVATAPLSPPTVGTQPYCTSATGQSVFQVTFDVASLGIQLTPGNYVVAIGYRTQSGIHGTHKNLESSIAGATDMQYDNGVGLVPLNTIPGATTGHLAIKISGVTQGDYQSGQ